MAVEREDERSRLEDKLKQLEEDLGDQTSSILFGTQLLIDHQNSSQKISSPDLPFSTHSASDKLSRYLEYHCINPLISI